MVAAPDYQSIIQMLEYDELNTTVGPVHCHVYSKLLALYVQQNDLCNAKFLWKRIPDNVKQTNPELKNIWTVGVKLWNREFFDAYTALNVEWSPEIAPIMQNLLHEVRARAIKVVSLAYSSLELENFAKLLNYPVEEAIRVAQEQKWEVQDTPTGKIVCPTRPPYSYAQVTSNEDQLAKLTEFVSFLEN